MAKGQGMEKISLQKLEQEVTCAICQEHYTEPKVLPCLHYYCKKCILKLALRTGKDKPFSCPECRSETRLPDGGVDELKSAFFINRFKSTFSALELAQGKVEVKCEACASEETAVSFCRQCAVFICNTCVEAHHRLKKMFEGHEVVSIQDLKEGRAKADITIKEPSPAKCLVHQELLKVYCFDCDLLICRDCTVKDHKDHNFEFTAVAAPTTKEDLMKELEPLRKVVGSLSLAMEEVRTTKQEIEVQGDSVTNTIHGSFNEIFHIMERRKHEMLEEAGRLVREKVDKLTVQEKNLSLAVAEVQSVVDYTERCVSHCTDNEVMSTHAEIRRRIEQETEEHSKPGRVKEPVVEADMGVEVRLAEDLQQLSQTKAKITRLAIDPAQCIMKGEGMKRAEVQHKADMTLTVRLSNNEIPTRKVIVTGLLKSMYNESVIKCDVDQSGPGEYRIQYTPTVRGRHELTVLVDEQHVAGSPFPVFVSIPPTQLGKPVSIWNGVSNPTGISINSNGEVIVAKQQEAPIVFYKRGEKVRSISRDQLKLKSYLLTSIPVDNEDYIYLTTVDSNVIMKRSKDGTSIIKRHSVKAAGHLYVKVVGEEVMVCERFNKGTIMVYDRELNYMRKIAGTDMGELSALAADSTGNIYATDWDKLRVHVFSHQGDHLRSFGCNLKGENILKKPLDLCVAGQFVYVCNNWAHNVCVFTTEGKLVTIFGQHGNKSGEFAIPYGVCIDADGFVYVCDADNWRVQVF